MALTLNNIFINGRASMGKVPEIPPGAQLFTSSFSIYDWVVPEGVTSFSVAGISGGGGGTFGTGAAGGGGGALAYANNISCVPGESIKIYSGVGGNAAGIAGFGTMGMPTVVYRQNQTYSYPFENVQLAIRASLGYDGSMVRKRVSLVAGSPAVNITSAQSKFNGFSYNFPEGTTGYLSIHNSRRFNTTSNNFTISFWVKHSSVGVGQVYMVRQVSSTNTDFRVAVGASGNLAFRYQNGLSIASATNTVQADGNWHHIAVTRTGNELRLFYDGNTVASATISGAMYYSPNLPIIIGQDQNPTGTVPFRGWIDDIVYVSGSSLWSDDFIPPTEPIEAGTAIISCEGGGAIGNSGGNLYGIFRYGDAGFNGGSGGSNIGLYAGGGGGGAGGYAGAGGNGASFALATGIQSASGASGTGGAAGGGGAYGGASLGVCYMAPGGGTGILGIGASGAGGVPGTIINNYYAARGGGGGSGGTTGGLSGSSDFNPVAGVYGGGGAGRTFNSTGGEGAAGGAGIVRIIWGTGKSYPSNAVV